VTVKIQYLQCAEVEFKWYWERGSWIAGSNRVRDGSERGA